MTLQRKRVKRPSFSLASNFNRASQGLFFHITKESVVKKKQEKRVQNLWSVAFNSKHTTPIRRPERLFICFQDVVAEDTTLHIRTGSQCPTVILKRWTLIDFTEVTCWGFEWGRLQDLIKVWKWDNWRYLNDAARCFSPLWVLDFFFYVSYCSLMKEAQKGVAQWCPVEVVFGSNSGSGWFFMCLYSSFLPQSKNMRTGGLVN